MIKKEKDKIIEKFLYNSQLFFIIASAFLLANAAIGSLKSFFKMTGTAETVFSIIALLLYCAANVIAIHAFAVMNMSCRLSEENNCFYLGRNLEIFAIVCFILTFFNQLVSIILYVVLNNTDMDNITPEQMNAVSNVWIVLGIVLMLVQIFSISTVFIVMFFRGNRFIGRFSDNRVKNLALFTVIVFIVQLVIGILASCYVIGGMNASFLSKFSNVLTVFKYAVLLVYFIVFRKGMEKKMNEPETQETENFEVNDANMNMNIIEDNSDIQD